MQPAQIPVPVFDDPKAPPAPSEAFVARIRMIEEGARKIEQLRAARLAAGQRGRHHHG